MLRYPARTVLLRCKSHHFTPVFKLLNSCLLMHLRTTNLIPRACVTGAWTPLCLTLGFLYHLKFFSAPKSDRFCLSCFFSAQNFSHPSLPTKHPPLYTQTHTHTCPTRLLKCRTLQGHALQTGVPALSQYTSCILFAQHLAQLSFIYASFVSCSSQVFLPRQALFPFCFAPSSFCHMVGC